MIKLDTQFPGILKDMNQGILKGMNEFVATGMWARPESLPECANGLGIGRDLRHGPRREGGVLGILYVTYFGSSARYCTGKEYRHYARYSAK